MTNGPCEWCGAPVHWLRYPKTGKLAPIDRQPNDRGNIVVNLAGGTYRMAGREETGIERHTNHWMTCPRADEHRAQKKARKTALKRIAGEDAP